MLRLRKTAPQRAMRRKNMIPLLTMQAVERKCSFEHVILLGNYELAYSLGVISRAAGLPKEEEFSNVGQLKTKVMELSSGYTPEKTGMQRLLRITKEMESYTDDYDDQMYELYSMGYDKGTVAGE